MNELKINKFIKKLLFVDGIGDNDIAFEYNECDNKYYIYNNFSLRLLEENSFSIKINKIIDETFTFDEINNFELVGNKIKLKELNNIKKQSLFNTFVKNSSVFFDKNRETLKSRKKIDTDYLNDYKQSYGVAS